MGLRARDPISASTADQPGTELSQIQLKWLWPAAGLAAIARVFCAVSAFALSLSGCASLMSSPAPATLLGKSAGSSGTEPASLVSEYRLANGLKLIVKEDNRAPTVVHMAWYRAGSIDEVNGKTGVAHVLEHMMFKGTKTTPIGEFSRRVAKMGGRENAFTSNDYTGYFQQVPKRHLAEVMALEADRMANLVLTREDFEKEIKVVMEERRLRTEDQAIALVHEALNAAAFVASPQRTPVVGWMNDLESMTVEDAQEWYDRFYTPANAIVVVVGDVRSAEVLAIAQKTYGVVPTRALPVRKPQIEPPQRGIRRVAVKAQAENPYVVMGFHVPRIENMDSSDREPYALEMLSAVLDADENGRLTRELVRGSRIADSVGASYDISHRGPSLFLLDGRPAAGKTVAELEQALRAQVRRIAEQGVREDELRRVKVQYVASQVYKRDSIMGQAMEIAGYEILGHSYRDADRMLEKIRSVSAAEVQAVAGKYFGDDALTVVELLPQPVTSAPRPPASPNLRHGS